MQGKESLQPELKELSFEQVFEELRQRFPDPEPPGLPGIYDNRRLVDALGPDLVDDLVNKFHFVRNKHKGQVRMALSWIADVVENSSGVFNKGGGNEGKNLWDTRKNMGWQERGGVILEEMSEEEREDFFELLYDMVGDIYWGSEIEDLPRMEKLESFHLSKIDELRLELLKQYSGEIKGAEKLQDLRLDFIPWGV